MSVATAETAATNPVEILAAHVVDTTFDDLPASAVLSAKTFILDSLGVGVAGSAGAWVSELLDAVAGWGTGDDSRAFVPVSYTHLRAHET